MLRGIWTMTTSFRVGLNRYFCIQIIVQKDVNLMRKPLRPESAKVRLPSTKPYQGLS